MTDNHEPVEQPQLPFETVVEQEFARVRRELVAVARDIKMLRQKEQALQQRLSALHTLMAPPSGAPDDDDELNWTRDDPVHHGLAGLTFRDAIRKVAEEFPGGFAPSQITEYLRMSDADLPQGKTGLGARVANEVWRMEKRGELLKQGAWYFPAPQASSEDDPPEEEG